MLALPWVRRTFERLHAVFAVFKTFFFASRSFGNNLALSSGSRAGRRHCSLPLDMRWKERCDAEVGTDDEWAARFKAHLQARSESAAGLIDASETVTSYPDEDVERLAKLRRRAIDACRSPFLKAKALQRFADGWFTSPCASLLVTPRAAITERVHCARLGKSVQLTTLSSHPPPCSRPKPRQQISS